MKKENEDFVTLKWGTLKSWRITSDRGVNLLNEYNEIGSNFSAMLQEDTPRQKEIICELIDIVPGDIYLDWDDVYVGKAEAKNYVINYRKTS